MSREPTRPGATFGRYLTTLRQRRGMSSAKLAHDACFDVSTISRLAAGTNCHPERATVLGLAGALHATAAERSYLLYLAGIELSMEEALALFDGVTATRIQVRLKEAPA